MRTAVFAIAQREYKQQRTGMLTMFVGGLIVGLLVSLIIMGALWISAWVNIWRWLLG